MISTISKYNPTKMARSKPQLCQFPQSQLSIQRAEYLKKLIIKVSLSTTKVENDHLIIIETKNRQNKISVQLVMRRLSELDALISHMDQNHGGHVIPVFEYDLYFQASLEMDLLIPAIEHYLNDLKYNKYCRQDLKFYCFLIEQNVVIKKQYTLTHVLNSATDISRKFLNDLFTRKTMSSLKNTEQMQVAHAELMTTIDHYNQIKQIALIKSKETIIFEEIVSIFTETSAIPSMAIEPQELDIDYVYKTVVACQKLITQAKSAYTRWEKLVETVRELQNNVYKGLHEYENQLNERNHLLKTWSQSLSQQLYELQDYLIEKMQAISGETFIISKKFVDLTVFAGQSVRIQEKQQSQSESKNMKSEGNKTDRSCSHSIKQCITGNVEKIEKTVQPEAQKVATTDQQIEPHNPQITLANINELDPKKR